MEGVEQLALAAAAAFFGFCWLVAAALALLGVCALLSTGWLRGSCHLNLCSFSLG